MNAPAHITPPLTVRTALDFGLSLDQTPRFWFGGDPFKTRVFDALAMAFPDGERYFIESVRLVRDQITDSRLQQEVRDFIRQEAQHGMAHEKYNDMMRRQGLPVDHLLDGFNRRFNAMLKNRPAKINLAITAASEHLTALMAECFFAHQDTLADVDPNMRALLAWHAIEEMEHRAVVFDVMNHVGLNTPGLRARALLMTTLMMYGFTLYRANELLKGDGFDAIERARLFAGGLPWLFGPRKGILAPMRSAYLQWFKPDFHPNDIPVVAQYPVWLRVFEETRNPLLAAEAFWAAGKPSAA